MLCDDRRENVLSALLFTSDHATGLPRGQDQRAGDADGHDRFWAGARAFPGQDIAGRNPVSAFGNHLGDLGRIVVFGTLVSIYWSAIGLGIAAFTNRKGVAAAIFIGGVFILTALANALYHAMNSSARRFLIVISPIDLLQAISHWLFGAETSSNSGSNVDLSQVDVSGLVFVAAVLGMAALCALIMYRRYLADE